MTNPRPDTHARIPVSDIATLLAERAEDLCRHLLPGGHREGSEWRCGSVQGEAGKSMGVHLNGTKTGRWKDYNGGESGDPIDLIQACLRLDKGEAVQWAKSWLGIDDRASTSTPRPRPAAKPESVDERAAKRTEAALVIWRASRDPIGTLTTT